MTGCAKVLVVTWAAFATTAIAEELPDAAVTESPRAELIGLYGNVDFPTGVFYGMPGLTVVVSPVDWFFFDAGGAVAPQSSLFHARLRLGVRTSWPIADSLLLWLGPVLGVRYLSGYFGHGRESGPGINPGLIGGGHWWFSRNLGLSLTASAGWNFWLPGANSVSTSIFNPEVTAGAGFVFRPW